MLIRAYCSSDLQAFAELMAELGYPTSISEMERRMDRMAADPEAHTFVAELSGDVVGMIGVKTLSQYETDDFVTYISCLVVKQKYRGQGYGKRLLQFIEEWSLGQGLNVLYLTSGMKEERKPAHELYKRMGFDITGFRFIKKLDQEE